MAGDHALERRARLLATRIQMRMTAMRDAVTPPGERPPFSVVMNRDKAMEFWSQNRFSEIGTMVLQNWKPEQVARLDAELSEWQTQKAAQAPDVLTDIRTHPSLVQYRDSALEDWMT